MLIVIEDLSKVDILREYAEDNYLVIEWEKEKYNEYWMQVAGDSTVLNRFYNIVLKYNREYEQTSKWEWLKKISEFFLKVLGYIGSKYMIEKDEIKNDKDSEERETK